MTKRSFRPGPTGALMDEYERASLELSELIGTIGTEDFLRICDPDSPDPEFRSIQKIMNHVVRAGYGYMNLIRRAFGEEWRERKQDYELTSPGKTKAAITGMLAYTEETCTNKWQLSHAEILAHPIQSTWEQVYDFEQLFEHAIVHVLRHRRQIERLLIKMKSEG